MHCNRRSLPIGCRCSRFPPLHTRHTYVATLSVCAVLPTKSEGVVLSSCYLFPAAPPPPGSPFLMLAVSFFACAGRPGHQSSELRLQLHMQPDRGREGKLLNNTPILCFHICTSQLWKSTVLYLSCFLHGSSHLTNVLLESLSMG